MGLFIQYHYTSPKAGRPQAHLPCNHWRGPGRAPRGDGGGRRTDTPVPGALAMGTLLSGAAASPPAAPRLRSVPPSPSPLRAFEHPWVHPGPRGLCGAEAQWGQGGPQLSSTGLTVASVSVRPRTSHT